MLGAILGDIIGSPYEFSPRVKDRDSFPLFCSRSRFTDDTVLTLAVARGMMEGRHSKLRTQDRVRQRMQEMALRYPNAGYGPSFLQWAMSGNPMAYGSWGNGSAMRVSSVGWLCNRMEDVLDFAEITASVTHNSREGIKGAQAVAGAVFISRDGASKSRIKSFAEKTIGYDLSDSAIDQIRQTVAEKPGYGVSCMMSVPLAFDAFLKSDSYEDTVRNAVAGGVDTDTVADMAGSIAEAGFGIPYKLRQQGMAYLDKYLLDIYNQYLAYLDI